MFSMFSTFSIFSIHISLISLYQFQTLQAAYISQALQPSYFTEWMKQMSTDLIKLETDASPDGWKCLWNRYALIDFKQIGFAPRWIKFHTRVVHYTGVI